VRSRASRAGAGCAQLGVAAAIAVAVACSGYSPPQIDPTLGAEWAVHRIDAQAIGESSGLVASRTYSGVFWTHNDSGDEARLFAIDASGALVGEFHVAGATHRDWEDIAADDAGHLYVGDFGNNSNDRRDLVVYRIPEPDPFADSATARADRALRFRYADQDAYPDPERRNFDAEALFWMDGELYLFTKQRSDPGTKLYRLPVKTTGDELALEPVARFVLPSDKRAYQATAADYQLVDGGLLALLTFGGIYLFERDDESGALFRPIHRIALTPRRIGQVESLAWDGDALLFGNEQRALFRIPDPLAIEHYPP
jgi:hypothetical protein